MLLTDKKIEIRNLVTNPFKRTMEIGQNPFKRTMEIGDTITRQYAFEPKQVANYIQYIIIYIQIYKTYRAGPTKIVRS